MPGCLDKRIVRNWGWCILLCGDILKKHIFQYNYILSGLGSIGKIESIQSDSSGFAEAEMPEPQVIQRVRN